MNALHKTFFILLNKQKCIQKHDNELNLFKLSSFVCKIMKVIQLLNPNKDEDM